MRYGYRPEEVYALGTAEKRVWQAIAELNKEQEKEMIRDAVIEAALFLFGKK